MRKAKPVESRTFAGMEQDVRLQSEAAAVHQAEELSAKLLEPRASIDAKAGEMERTSPLFYGKVEPTLF